jgi:hypothetical protein
MRAGERGYAYFSLDVEMLSAMPIICGIALVIIVFASFYFEDLLIRREYEFHRDAWEQDGRPTGHLFHPPEVTWLGSPFALLRCGFRWLFRTPRWIREDVVAKTLLWRFRCCAFIWLVGAPIFAAFFLTHAATTHNV